MEIDGLSSISEEDAIELKASEDMIDKTIKDVSLKVLHTATDKMNFDILQVLPLTINELENRLDIGEYTCYRKLKQLERARLINGVMTGNAEIEATNLGKYIVELVHHIMLKVDANIKDEMKAGSMKITQKSED